MTPETILPFLPLDKIEILTAKNQDGTYAHTFRSVDKNWPNVILDIEEQLSIPEDPAHNQYSLPLRICL